jgi:serine O-acetyltransferase
MRVLYRLAVRANRAGIPLLPTLISRLVRMLFACEISYLADIHPTVRFPHKALGVVIGDGVVVGRGSTVLQNVTMGGRAGSGGGPVIGQGVLVGAGACVLGDITVGDGASIGANAVVIRDVPSGAVAVGVPAEIKLPV